jgi:hypothetical protein
MKEKEGNLTERRMVCDDKVDTVSNQNRVTFLRVITKKTMLLLEMYEPDSAEVVLNCSFGLCPSSGCYLNHSVSEIGSTSIVR